MSYKDYKDSIEISSRGYTFYTLVFVLMETGDPEMTAKLATIWPELSVENRPYDYECALKIVEYVDLPSPGAFLFSLLRAADTDNARLLEQYFPVSVREFRARYNAPGGYLEPELRLMRQDPIWQAMNGNDGERVTGPLFGGSATGRFVISHSEEPGMDAIDDEEED